MSEWRDFSHQFSCCLFFFSLSLALTLCIPLVGVDFIRPLIKYGDPELRLQRRRPEDIRSFHFHINPKRSEGNWNTHEFIWCSKSNWRLRAKNPNCQPRGQPTNQPQSQTRSRSTSVVLYRYKERGGEINVPSHPILIPFHLPTGRRLHTYLHTLTGACVHSFSAWQIENLTLQRFIKRRNWQTN